MARCGGRFQLPALQDYLIQHHLYHSLPPLQMEQQNRLRSVSLLVVIFSTGWISLSAFYPQYRPVCILIPAPSFPYWSQQSILYSVEEKAFRSWSERPFLFSLTSGQIKRSRKFERLHTCIVPFWLTLIKAATQKLLFWYFTLSEKGRWQVK